MIKQFAYAKICKLGVFFVTSPAVKTCFGAEPYFGVATKFFCRSYISERCWSRIWM